MREFEVKQKVVFSMLNVNCLSINNYCCVFVVICTFADCCLIFDVHKKIAQVCVMVLLRHHVIWPFMFKALTLWIFFFWGGGGGGCIILTEERENCFAKYVFLCSDIPVFIIVCNYLPFYFCEKEITVELWKNPYCTWMFPWNNSHSRGFWMRVDWAFCSSCLNSM